jgi:ArsR family transcriptional regulator
VKLDFARGAALFKALSDETRVRIVHIIASGEVCACELLEYFDLTQPTLSHHLAILVESGLVIPRSEGKWVYYRLDASTLELLAHYIPSLLGEGEAFPCGKKKRNCE